MLLNYFKFIYYLAQLLILVYLLYVCRHTYEYLALCEPNDDKLFEQLKRNNIHI